jgi:pyruvate dehydrogenase E2 component (dihydrolipoamide acetyltransferase)
MKTRLLTIVLLAAAFGVASCKTSGQSPAPPAPGPNPGTGTAAPPNPNPAPAPEPPPAATPIALNVPTPAPALAVPDQPLAPRSTSAVARPHDELVKLKRAGASDEVLLAKVRADGVNYALTTADVAELKAAGFSETVLEAMLRSGRSATTR